ncbi:MAG: apolipoprotein N-acyltransferase [Myxococcales bacterium]
MDRLRSAACALALPTVAGILYFLSWIGFGFWPLAFVCFVPLLASLREATPRQALGRGAWMGFVTHLGGYAWVVHMLQVFAFLPTPLAVLGYLLLCAGQGFLFGVLAFVIVHVRRRTCFRLVTLLPLALCAVEWSYPLLFQSYTGVALLPLLPLVQVADLGGVLLLSGLQAVVNGAVADALFARGAPPATPPRGRLHRPGPLTVSALCLALAFAYGSLRMLQIGRREAAAPHLAVGLAQPNVGEIALHEDPMASVLALRQETVELHGRGAELVIWPETAFNAHAIELGPGTGRELQGNVPVGLIAGVVRVDRARNVWNSAVLVSKDGVAGDHYDKIKLLAFGEYIPFGDWFPIIYKWSPMSSHLSAGTSTAPLRDGRYSFATIVCYEDILPGLVREVMSDHGGGRAHALVNLTNDSWYGSGHEQEQHLMLAAVRSIEHRRWLLRATSTGISAFVDATGAVVERIPRDVRGVAVRDVPMMTGSTVYQRLGDWPGYLSALVLAFVLVRGALRDRRVSRGQAAGRTGAARAPADSR